MDIIKLLKVKLYGKLMKDKIVREQECKEITGLSRVTRWRLEQTGKFPGRRHISPGTVGWLLSEIEEWLKSRATVSQQGSNASCK